MYHFHPTPPSGLRQQQPQRYSDRHRLYSPDRIELAPHDLRATGQQNASDKSSQLGDGSEDGMRNEQLGIRSYLKKSDAADLTHMSNMADARVAKPETDIEANELKRAGKPNLSLTKKAS